MPDNHVPPTSRAFIALTVTLLLLGGAPSLAQDQETGAGSAEVGAPTNTPDAGTSEEPAKPKRPVKKKQVAKPKAAKTAVVPAASPRAATPAAAAAPAPTQTTSAAAGAPGSTPNVAAKLEAAGVGACATQLDELAAGTMRGVTQFNTASNWAKAAADKRLVTISIGQKFADGAAVPATASSILAAPNPQGTCDAVSVQVVPSPLPCAKLKESLSIKGKQIGDLAGVLLMEDAGVQTMLVPTAANTCVLVGTRFVYAK